MFEQPSSQQGQEKKTYKSSIEEMADYLNERSKKYQEGKGSVVDVISDAADVYKGFQFFNKKGPHLKSLGKEIFSSILENPGSFEDLLTQGAVKAQKIVAGHIREGIEKKVEIKGNTARSLLDLEEEEQRLAAMRAHLEAAEALVSEQKKAWTNGQKFSTVDSKESLKNEGQQAATKRREAGQQSADSFFARIFSNL